MRKLAALALVGAMAVAGCAPKMVALPVVTSPKFPDFIQPPIPPGLSSSLALPLHERGWTFLQAGDFRNAERELELALRVEPAFYPSEAAAGYLDLARNDPKSALARFDRALDRQGDYTSALVGRGEALVALNREIEAVGAFELAVAADASLVDLRRRIEVLKFRGLERDLAAARQAARTGKQAEAIYAYQAAIARSPESAFLYRELAAVERQTGAIDQALTHFRRAVELDPSDAASLAQIGELLESRGDSDGALSAYQDSLAHEANDTVEARRDALIARAELAKLPEEYRAIETAPQVTRGDLAALIGVRLSSVVQQMRAREGAVITDVRSYWAEPWIVAVARAGILEPFANHTFQPRNVVRRTDLADAVSRLLARLATPAQLKIWQNSDVKFTDLPTGHLAYPAASVAVASGVMTAAGAGDTFDATRIVTGAEAAAAVQRLEQMASSTAARDNRAR